MYRDYIVNRGNTSEAEILAAEHIDILTYNRIEYDKLTDYQVQTLERVHSRLTAFETENEAMIKAYLNSYAINGVQMTFGNSWNLKVVGGVAIPQDLYSMLRSTGLCYPAI